MNRIEKRALIDRGICYQCGGPLEDFCGTKACHNCRITPDAPTDEELVARAQFWKDWKIRNSA